MNRQIIKNILTSNSTYSYAIIIVLLFASLIYFDAKDRVLAVTKNEKAELQAASPILALTETNNNETQNKNSNEVDKIVEDVSAVNEEGTAVPHDAEVVMPQTEETPVDIRTETEKEEDFEKNAAEEEPVSESTEESVQEEAIEDAPSLSLPFTESVFEKESTKWNSGYGKIEFINQRLVIGGGEDTAYLALLDSSSNLNNYEYNVLLDWNRGKSAQLVARFENFGNFVTCSFSTNGSGVTIVSTLGGTRTVHGSSAGLKTKSFEGWKDLSFGMKVEDTTLHCLRDKEIVLSQDIPDMPLTGGVGIALWSEFPGEALAHIKNVEIKEITN